MRTRRASKTKALGLAVGAQAVSSPIRWLPHHGLHALWDGLKLLAQHPKWWAWLAIPMLLNLLVGACALWTAWTFLAGLPAGAAASLAAVLPAQFSSWLMPWLSGFLGLVLGAAVLLAVGWALARFGVILGAPFYGQLAEAVAAEVAPGLMLDAPFSLRLALKDLCRSLGTESLKLFLGLGLWAFGLLLGLIPLIGPFLSLTLAFAVTATFVCLDAFDTPLSRKGYGFWCKLAWVWSPQRRAAHAAFAAASLPFTILPGINFLGLPLVLASGAAWTARRLAEEDKINNP